MTATLNPPETKDRQAAATSEFILQRIIRNDQQGTPGWRLNVEMRGEFSRMLRDREEAKSRSR